jgi:chitodextrinase
VGASRVELSWNASSDNVGVAGYFVYRDGKSLGKAVSTRFIDTLVSPNTSYVYRVEAFDAAGNISARDSIVKVTSAAPQTGDSQAPTVPGALAVVSLQYNKVAFNWNPSSDNTAVAGYDIYRDGLYLATVTADKANYTDAAVTGFTPCSYLVEAFDAAGNRSASPELALVTPRDPALPTAAPAAPAGLSVAGGGSGSVTGQGHHAADRAGQPERAHLRDQRLRQLGGALLGRFDRQRQGDRIRRLSRPAEDRHGYHPRATPTRPSTPAPAPATS